MSQLNYQAETCNADNLKKNGDQISKLKHKEIL